MSTFFCLTCRFLQPLCHARTDRGEPKWPPSPLRAFQALVCASAARWNERIGLAYAVPALRWLEQQPAPLIIAAASERSRTKYRLYVPNNVGDLVAASWGRGGEKSIADYRTEKDVCPTHLLHDDPAVSFLWPVADLDPNFEKSKEILFTAARSITHLGWGIDMVVANTSVISDADAERLPGERWTPTDDQSTTGYRVPKVGTLNALIDKHHAFLNRIGPEGFRPVPPLTNFNVVGYRRAIDPPKRSFAAFNLLTPDTRGDFRPFDTPRKGIIVAAMMRHAVGHERMTRALGWSQEKVASFIFGHGEPLGEIHRPVDGLRLAYIPVPSIESRGQGRAEVVGPIRRAIIVVFGGLAHEDLQQIARLLPNTDLFPIGQSAAVAQFSRVLTSDRMIGRYTEPAATWETVTPIVLPGYDDPRKPRKRLFPKTADAASTGAQEQMRLLGKLDTRIDYLIRKSIRQSGFAEELVQNAEIEWQGTGFWPGTDLATRYVIPEKLRRFRRLHVRITWRERSGKEIKIPGPICLGGGRFCGLGLFAH